jgi:hypothetical protein
MERHELNEAIVIPVILRPCDWHDTPFGKLQAAPKDGKAITRWANPDEAFLDVVMSIKRALKAQGAKASPPSGGVTPPSLAGTPISQLRSSNLRVNKRFTERDKDQFIHDGFEYFAKFFDNSLKELERRNPGIEHAFKRIDGNRFTAVAYRDGEKVCQCSVFVGGIFSKGIGYSGDDRGQTNSFNDMLSVEADDQALYFKTMGFSSYRSNDHERLGFEGGAEHLWEMFIEPLQRH